MYIRQNFSVIYLPTKSRNRDVTQMAAGTITGNSGEGEMARGKSNKKAVFVVVLKRKFCRLGSGNWA